MNPQEIPSHLSAKMANASLVGAAMVVFIHVWFSGAVGSSDWLAYEFVSEGLCRWAVPFFFCASGFFLAGHIGSSGWYQLELRKRFQSLLIPYVLWNIAYWAFMLLLDVGVAVSQGRQVVIQFDPVNVFGLNLSKMPICFPNWYLRSLILLVVLSPVLIALSKRAMPLLMFFLLCAVMHVFFPLTATWPCLDYLFSPIAGFWFLVGLNMRGNLPLVERLCNVPRTVSVGLISVAMVTICGMVFCRLHGNEVIHKILFILLVPILVVFLLNVMPSRRMSLTQAAFPIYVLHLFAIQVVELGFSAIGLGKGLRGSFAGYLLRGMLCCILVAMFYLAMKRIFKERVRFLFGGRA